MRSTTSCIRLEENRQNAGVLTLSDDLAEKRGYRTLRSRTPTRERPSPVFVRYRHISFHCAGKYAGSVCKCVQTAA